MLIGATPFSDPNQPGNQNQIAKKVVKVEINWPKGFRKTSPVACSLIEKVRSTTTALTCIHRYCYCLQLLVRDPDKRFGVKQALKASRTHRASTRGQGTGSPNQSVVKNSRRFSPSKSVRSSSSFKTDATLLSCSGGINPAEGMKAHNFFDGVDWEAILYQREKAPFIPDLDDCRDCCMFQEFSRYNMQSTRVKIMSKSCQNHVKINLLSFLFCSDEDDTASYDSDGTGWSEGF